MCHLGAEAVSSSTGTANASPTSSGGPRRKRLPEGQKVCFHTRLREYLSGHILFSEQQQFDDGASELRVAPSCGERLSSRECQCAADSECGGAEWGPDFLKDGYCFLAYIQAGAKLYFGILRMTVTRLLAESFVRLT